MKKNKEEINMKKVVVETILIPLCVVYLYYMAMHNHPKVNMIFLYGITLIACFEMIIKYAHEVYVYENKYNYLKVICIIISVLLIISVFLNIFLKYKAILYTFISLLIILLIYLLLYSAKNIKKMIKQEGVLYKNTFSAFFSLIEFGIILIGIIIYL